MINRHLTPSISTEQYTDAVNNLVKWAQRDCGGSKVCAQMLLSAYNGDEFQLNIVDLRLLDETLYRDAITVIRARVELNIEPHVLMDGLDLIFKGLWQQWKHYHVSNRGKADNHGN
jgi:hypothetical protein